MQGGTTFTFVTGGIESALDQARAAAGDRDGAGERLFDGVPALNLQLVSARSASLVTPYRIQR